MTQPANWRDDIDHALAVALAAPLTTGPGEDGPHHDALRPGREWLPRLLPLGFAVPKWPSQHGGCDATDDEARLIAEAVARVRPPDLYEFAIGLHVAGPTLLLHGTEQQRDRWLRPIASGSEIVCQMFSEPDAGSDLANVATLATRAGDGWVLQGQKVWTSRGAYADWGLCLARHDSSLPKHQGLTMFMVNMRSTGITVRPLVQMDRGTHFSEVFVDSVEVSDRNRVGAVGEGWAVAMSALAFERQSVQDHEAASPRLGEAGSWLRSALEENAAGDPVMRQRAMKVFILEQLEILTALRAQAAAREGRAPGAAGSGGKLRHSLVFTARARLLEDLSGASGMLADHPAIDAFLMSPSMGIRGGTDQIQRNIIAERLLGLPGETRTDRGLPWTESRRGRST